MSATSFAGEKGNELRQRHGEKQKALNVNDLTGCGEDQEKVKKNVYFGKEAVNYWSQGTQNILLGLVLIGFVLRFVLINDPSEVIFDEVHFGGFMSNYLRREYYFDVHPPLGKLMIAAVGYLFGFDGSFSFKSIGDSYINSSAPYITLRTFMVVLSLASIALSYATVIEMGFGTLAASICATLLVFDNALVIQSRIILLDAPLAFFISLAIWAWIKFRQQRKNPFSLHWFIYLATTGFAIGCGISVKMVGLFTILTIGLATIFDLWELSDYQKRALDNFTVAKHVSCRVLTLILLPISIYIASYYIHFEILNLSGPGDSLMSAEFQGNLKGNMLHENSRSIYYGQPVRIKNRGESIYLHSHNHRYPRVHDDGKVSSEGQQVTGYPIADDNNVWLIVSPEDSIEFIQIDSPPVSNEINEDEEKEEEPFDERNLRMVEERYIKNNANLKLQIQPSINRQLVDGDEIRLLHTQSGKMLYTHDVASPNTRTNMEVTAVFPGAMTQKEHEESSIWRIEIVSGTVELFAQSCQFRLINKKHGVALTNWQMALPKWGFAQREINADRRGLTDGSRWVIWDVLSPLPEEERVAIASRPKKKLSFFQKYIELQKLQIKINSKLIDRHPYKSDPITWPFVIRGTSYWDRDRNARIYLLGNPIAWYICVIGIFMYVIYGCVKAFRVQRGALVNHSDRLNTRFNYRIGFLFLAWAMHYLPFFTMSRTLYIHHYLPSYTISTMITGCLIGYASNYVRRPFLFKALLLIAGCAIMASFFYFAPITYGTKISSDDLSSRKWMKSWDWP